MKNKPYCFKEPLYTTKPMLPKFESYEEMMRDLWKSRWLTNSGKFNIKLEEEMKTYLNVKNVSLCCNGTSALEIACRALGLSKQVITTPFTFPATVNVLSWLGIEPVFCDIDYESMTIDTDKLKISDVSGLTGIVGVHVYGTPCDTLKIDLFAKKNGLKVIYDCAHAFGVTVKGKGIGNFGDASVFSFHATKLFHTAEGGCVTTEIPEVKKTVDLMKNFGIKNENEVVLSGINGKMNEFQAAMGLKNLEILPAEYEKRRNLDRIYRENLCHFNNIKLLPMIDSIRPSHQYFIIRVKSIGKTNLRDVVYEELKKYNVFSRKYFSPLCSNFEHFKHLKSASPVNLPIACKVEKEVLALPFYGDLSEDNVVNICEIIQHALKR